MLKNALNGRNDKEFSLSAQKMKLAACALLSLAAAAPAAASTESGELAQCFLENASGADLDVMVQWAYVTIGRTQAAQRIQKIPEAKAKAVEQNAQKALANLVAKRCAKPALKLLAKDPKNGLQDALESFAVMLAKKEAAKRSSPVLPLTITDLLRR